MSDIGLEEKGEVPLVGCTLSWEPAEEDCYDIYLGSAYVGIIEPRDLVEILSKYSKEHLVMSLKRKISVMSMQIDTLEKESCVVEPSECE